MNEKTKTNATVNFAGNQQHVSIYVGLKMPVGANQWRETTLVDVIEQVAHDPNVREMARVFASKRCNASRFDSSETLGCEAQVVLPTNSTENDQ